MYKFDGYSINHIIVSLTILCCVPLTFNFFVVVMMDGRWDNKYMYSIIWVFTCCGGGFFIVAMRTATDYDDEIRQNVNCILYSTDTHIPMHVRYI